MTRKPKGGGGRTGPLALNVRPLTEQDKALLERVQASQAGLPYPKLFPRFARAVHRLQLEARKPGRAATIEFARALLLAVDLRYDLEP